MAKKEIGVRMNLPTTPEGKARLEAALVAFNSRVIANVLNKHPEFSYAEKVRWVESLNGVVPWANAGGT